MFLRQLIPKNPRIIKYSWCPTSRVLLQEYLGSCVRICRELCLMDRGTITSQGITMTMLDCTLYIAQALFNLPNHCVTIFYRLVLSKPIIEMNRNRFPVSRTVQMIVIQLLHLDFILRNDTYKNAQHFDASLQFRQ
mgnify:CR=1 FL=1